MLLSTETRIKILLSDLLSESEPDTESVPEKTFCTLLSVEESGAVSLPSSKYPPALSSWKEWREGEPLFLALLIRGRVLLPRLAPAEELGVPDELLLLNFSVSWRMDGEIEEAMGVEEPLFGSVVGRPAVVARILETFLD